MDLLRDKYFTVVGAGRRPLTSLSSDTRGWGIARACSRKLRNGFHVGQRYQTDTHLPLSG